MNNLATNIFISIMLITVIVGYDIAHTNPVVKAQEPQNDTKIKVIEKEVVKYIEPDTPEEYIKYVFGKDSDKAFLLLKGNGTKDACAENRYLNPKAKNDNTEWGGRGIDWGVFQINDSWQGVNPKFLLNWKVNIEVAHQLYVENGNSFKLWTCGKVYGI